MKKTVHLTTSQKVKNYIWHKIYYIFPRVQNFLVKSHLIWHDKERQKFHIGWVAPDKTLKDVENHLHEKWNFGNHFVAWVDSGQVLSWRKLIDFNYQYHLRIFSDGEIRGHYEYTPESKPIDHFTEVDEEARIEEFKKFLGEFAVYDISQKHAKGLKPDLEIAPESEITVDSLSTEN
jgi:hypothetical protein